MLSRSFPVQRRAGLLHQQRAQHLRIGARDPPEFDTADDLPFVLGELIAFGRRRLGWAVWLVGAGGAPARVALRPRQRHDQAHRANSDASLLGDGVIGSLKLWPSRNVPTRVPLLTRFAGPDCPRTCVHRHRNRGSPSLAVVAAKLMWSPYNKQGSPLRSRCSRWNSLSGIPARFCFRPSAPRGSNGLPPRASPSSAAAPPDRRWLRYCRAPALAISASSIAITSSPATCNARCCSTSPMPPTRFPRQLPRRAKSRASIPQLQSNRTLPISPPTTCTSCSAPSIFILDGTDNFETRYLINDFAVSQCVPWIYAAAVASYGVTMTVLPGRDGLPRLCLSRFSPRRR